LLKKYAGCLATIDVSMLAIMLGALEHDTTAEGQAVHDLHLIPHEIERSWRAALWPRGTSHAAARAAPRDR
jgi:hypothetical protein